MNTFLTMIEDYHDVLQKFTVKFLGLLRHAFKKEKRNYREALVLKYLFRVQRNCWKYHSSIFTLQNHKDCVSGCSILAIQGIIVVDSPRSRASLKESLSKFYSL